MDENLDVEIVYQSLNYRWSFHGLEVSHFLLAGGVTMLVFFMSIPLGYSTLYGVVFFVAACSALAVVQWRKPHDYLSELFDLVTQPRQLNCLDDDAYSAVFPVAHEELWAKEGTS